MGRRRGRLLTPAVGAAASAELDQPPPQQGLQPKVFGVTPMGLRGLKAGVAHCGLIRRYRLTESCAPSHSSRLPRSLTSGQMVSAVVQHRTSARGVEASASVIDH